MFKFIAQSKGISPIQTIASRIDQFAKQPTFRILSEEKYHTSCGILTTIGLITICIIYLVSEFKDLLSYNDPSILISQELVKADDQIYLTNNNFTFAIVMVDFTYAAVQNQEKYFTFSIKNCHRQRKLNETSGKLQISENCTYYEVENCARHKHFVTQEQLQFFANYNLTNMLCPNQEQWEQTPMVKDYVIQKLQGHGYGQDFQYIALLVDKCKNSTKQICETQENIDEKLQTVLYAVYLSDALIKMEQQGIPYQENIEIYFEVLSLTNSKTVIQGYRKIDTFTDNGLFLKNQKYDPTIVMGTQQITSQYYNQQYLICQFIQMDSKRDVYRRSYIKVQSILGTIGGLWNFFQFIFTIVLSQAIQRLMTISISEQLFNFEQNDELEDEVQEKPCKDLIKQHNNLEDKEDVQKQQQYLENHLFDKRIQSQIMSRDYSLSRHSKLKLQSSKQIVELSTNTDLQLFLKQRNKSLNLGKLQYLQLIFGCKKLLKKQLDYASNKIIQKMDIAYLLQKILEIDKLKQILLTEDQLNLFEYIPKPVIPLEIFEDQFKNKINQLELLKPYKFILGEEKSDSLKIQLAFSSYMKIQKQPKKSLQDYQLLSQLDHKIIDLFHKLSNDSGKLEQVFKQNEYQQVLQYSQRLEPESIDREIIHIE